MLPVTLTPDPPRLTTWTPSAELWRLLSTGPKENIEDIAKVPTLKAECEASLRHLDILIEPAGDKIVINALGPLVLVFGKSVEAESPVFWKVYTQALSDLPRMSLDRAVTEWQKVGKFFPKPAEIRELAETHAQPLRQARFRAKSALEVKPSLAKPGRNQMSREQYDAIMGDFLAKMKAKEPPPAHTKRPPPPCGIPAEGSQMTPEMRALIERTP
jgi:hypothetical protein